MVLVSVVMSSYNHEKFIADSIESVLNQTHRDLELIITDDYSTDASPKIITNYKQKDPRVIAAFHSRNRGITKTLNDGLDQVQGKYVCFLDSDDVWMENKLEKQLEVLNRDDTKLVWTEGEIIDAQGQKTGQLFTNFLNAPPNKNGDLFQQLLSEQFILLQTVIFRSDYIRKVRFDSDLKYVNDHRFLVDLAVHHDFLFMPERLARYRVHSNNITSKKELDWAKDKILIRKYFLDKYSGKICQRAKADIIYQIGFYLSRLGKKSEAKKYYLQALKIDHAHINSALYTALALTSGDGLSGRFMLNSYKLTTALIGLIKSGGYSINGSLPLISVYSNFYALSLNSGQTTKTPSERIDKPMTMLTRSTAVDN
jgi:glycosyltransferase involved in cell wall biosynthesis